MASRAAAWLSIITKGTAVGESDARARSFFLRGRRRQRDAASRVVEEETQGFLSLGTAEGGTQRSEREGGKLVLGESTHSRVHLRF